MSLLIGFVKFFIFNFFWSFPFNHFPTWRLLCVLFSAPCSEKCCTYGSTKTWILSLRIIIVIIPACGKHWWRREKVDPHTLLQHASPGVSCHVILDSCCEEGLLNSCHGSLWHGSLSSLSFSLTSSMSATAIHPLASLHPFMQAIWNLHTNVWCNFSLKPSGMWTRECNQ